MKTIEIKLYEFDELPEEVKQKVLTDLYDINVFHEWWENVYEDAKNIGLEIRGFDIGRGNCCNGIFELSASEVAANIFRDHGEKCETYKTAEGFIEDWQPLFDAYMDERSDNYESDYLEDRMIEEEQRFLNSLLHDYLQMLKQEHEYRTEEENIIDTIRANEYFFTEKGKIYTD